MRVPWCISTGLFLVLGFAHATDPGIYVEDAATKAQKAITGTVTLNPRGKNVGAALLTFGLVKPKMVFAFNGNRAGLRLPAQPTFRFHFGPKLDPSSAMQDPTLMMNQMAGAGMPLNASKPGDFVLLAPEVQGETRELILVQKHGSAVPTNPTFELVIEKLDDGDFLVRPKTALPRGEYGFYCSSPGAMPTIWAFGVD